MLNWTGLIVLLAAPALIIVGPFVAQNVSVFGSPSGPVTQSTISTDLTIPAAAANIVRSTAADFMIGNGNNGVETIISSNLLRGFHHVFNQFDISQSDQHYALGTYTNAFAKANYTMWDRSEDYGADPWNVVLICVSIAILVIAVARGDRTRRKTLLVAVSLTLGYLAFCGIARWSVFAVRYQMPEFVAWSPVIAVALSSFPKMVSRIVLCFLVISCVPQLFNNSEKPFIHQDYAAKSLAPYFLDTYIQDYVLISSAEYQSVSSAIAETTCHQVGLKNWIFVEYPLWAGLKNAGWQGKIESVDVRNASRRFEDPSFDPCILLRQVAGRYEATNAGQVQLQFGQLALALDPKDIGALSWNAPGFKSRVPNVRVFPGGGWSFKSQSATLVHRGSVFLVSPVRQNIKLQFASSSAHSVVNLVVDAPGAGLKQTMVTGNTGISMTIPAGITELGLERLSASSSISRLIVDPALAASLAGGTQQLGS